MKYYDGKNMMTGACYDFSVAALDHFEAEAIFAHFTGDALMDISVSKIDRTSLDDEGLKDAQQRRDEWLEAEGL